MPWLRATINFTTSRLLLIVFLSILNSTPVCYVPIKTSDLLTCLVYLIPTSQEAYKYKSHFRSLLYTKVTVKWWDKPSQRRWKQFVVLIDARTLIGCNSDEHLFCKLRARNSPTSFHSPLSWYVSRSTDQLRPSSTTCWCCRGRKSKIRTSSDISGRRKGTSGCRWRMTRWTNQVEPKYKDRPRTPPRLTGTCCQYPHRHC